MSGSKVLSIAVFLEACEKTFDCPWPSAGPASERKARRTAVQEAVTTLVGELDTAEADFIDVQYVAERISALPRPATRQVLHELTERADSDPGIALCERVLRQQGEDHDPWQERRCTEAVGKMELEWLGLDFVVRFLQSTVEERTRSQGEGTELAERLQHEAMNLAHNRATEFSKWIGRLDLVAAKIDLLIRGPGHKRVQYNDSKWGLHQQYSVGRRAAEEYQRFRAAYLGGEGLLELVLKAWGWAVPEALEILALSSFGNLLVRCDGDAIWRIRPEDLRAEEVVPITEGPRSWYWDEEGRIDWEAPTWVEAARGTLGPVEVGQCYGFKKWPVLESEHAVENMAIKSIHPWIAVSGDEAKKVI